MTSLLLVNVGGAVDVAAGGTNRLLLETADYILQENGDFMALE